MPNPNPKTSHLKGKRTGRPRSGRVQITTTIKPELRDAVKAYATKNGLSFNVALEELIEAGLKQKQRNTKPSSHPHKPGIK